MLGWYLMTACGQMHLNAISDVSGSITSLDYCQGVPGDVHIRYHRSYKSAQQHCLHQLSRKLSTMSMPIIQ